MFSAIPNHTVRSLLSHLILVVEKMLTRFTQNSKWWRDAGLRPLICFFVSRLPTLLQVVGLIIILAFLPFVPESPRTLFLPLTSSCAATN